MRIEMRAKVMFDSMQHPVACLLLPVRLEKPVLLRVGAVGLDYLPDLVNPLAVEGRAPCRGPEQRRRSALSRARA